MLRVSRTLSPVAWLLCGPLLTAGAAVDPAGYLTVDALDAAVLALPNRHADGCRVVSIGRSRGGHDIWALELARGVNLEQRSALAVVAGIDGDHPASTAVALRVANGLLEAEADTPARTLLERHVVYVLPCVNPDARKALFMKPQREHRGTLRAVDDDRDGSADEDGPEDLNGDGMITMMRVLLEGRRVDDLVATHIADAVEPRLAKAADRNKGETPRFVVLTEGHDNDNDGLYNEDGPGTVDLNSNFTHLYEEHSPGAGPYQISEPESKALIDFFLEHPRIAAALFYGRHDNVARSGGGEGRRGGAAAAGGGGSGGRGRAGRGAAAGRGGGGGRGGPPGGGRGGFRRQRPEPPKDLHEDDVALYKTVQEKYVELTGIKRAPKEGHNGAAFAWAYAEYGIPSFACRVWTRPEPPKEEAGEEPEAKAGGADAGEATEDSAEPNADSGSPDNDDSSAAESQSGDAAEPADAAGAAEAIADDDDRPRGRRRGPRGRRGGRGRRGEPGPDAEAEKKKKKEPADKEGAAWLKYSDDHRDGAGFVPWTPFEHPQLGAVEIGGFAPFFRTTPPADALDDMAEKQLAFVMEIGGRLPKPVLDPPVVTQLSSGVFEIRSALRNEGFFPTGLAIARQNRRARPIVIMLNVDSSRVLGGSRIERIWSIAGSGGRHDLRWVILGDAGSTVDLKMTSHKFGDRTVSVTLSPTNSGD